MRKVGEVVSELLERPEEGMWKLCPLPIEECVECEESRDVSTEGNGAGPERLWEGGGVRVCWRGDAL